MLTYFTKEKLTNKYVPEQISTANIKFDSLSSGQESGKGTKGFGTHSA
jgi:hypothetical protein